MAPCYVQSVSPGRPLYMRLEDEFNARQAAEEEEKRKRLQEQANNKRVSASSVSTGIMVS